MSKPRYRYWESATHPRYRAAWVLVGGPTEYAIRARAGWIAPLLLHVKGGQL